MRVSIRLTVTAVVCASVGGIGAFAYVRVAGPTRPCLVVQRDVDLGEHYKNSVIHSSFAIDNLGQEPLVVWDFKTSCGCVLLTKASGEKLPDERQVVPPRGRFEVDLSLVAKPGEGESFAYVVRFRSNDPVNDEVHVRLTGKARLGVEATPRALNFGRLGAEEKAQGSLRVTDHRKREDRGPFVLVSNSPSLSLGPKELSPPKVHREGTGDTADIYDVRVALTMPKGEADLDARIVVREENGRDMCDIPVRAFIRRKWAVAPAEVAFAVNPGRGEREREQARWMTAVGTIGMYAQPLRSIVLHALAPLLPETGQIRRCVVRSTEGPVEVEVVKAPQVVRVGIRKTSDPSFKYIDVVCNESCRNARALGDIVLAVKGQKQDPGGTIRIPVFIR
jgi:Protein of unknown function (DUF1573)